MFESAAMLFTGHMLRELLRARVLAAQGCASKAPPTLTRNSSILDLPKYSGLEHAQHLLYLTIDGLDGTIL